MKEIKKEDIQDNTILALSDTLIYIRKDKRIIIAEPESASWMVVDADVLRIIKQMEKPVSFNTFVSANPRIPEETLKNLLLRLYNRQIVSVGYKFYYDTKTMWDYEYRLPYFHVVRVSSACNFSCKYCYAHPKYGKGELMKLDTLKLIIERVLAELPNRCPTIEYHGGEPMLNFDVIVKGTEFGYSIKDKYGKDITFLIQSNGSLFTEENVKILRDLNIGIGTSIDGGADIHNKYRVYHDGRGTFDDVWKGFENLRKVLPGSGLLADIVEPEDLEKAYDEIIGMGVTDFALKTVFPTYDAADLIDISGKRTEDFAVRLLKIFDKLVEKNINNLNKGKKDLAALREISHVMSNLLHKERRIMCLRAPCGAGNDVSGFNARGEIFSCDCLTDVAELKIGTVFDMKPLGKIFMDSPVYKAIYARIPDAITKCKTCPWKNVCMTGCPVGSYHLHKSLFREDFFCKYYKILIENIIWRISDNPKILNAFIEDGEVKLPGYTKTRLKSKEQELNSDIFDVLITMESLLAEGAAEERSPAEESVAVK